MIKVVSDVFLIPISYTFYAQYPGLFQKKLRVCLHIALIPPISLSGRYLEFIATSVLGQKHHARYFPYSGVFHSVLTFTSGYVCLCLLETRTKGAMHDASKQWTPSSFQNGNCSIYSDN